MVCSNQYRLGVMSMSIFEIITIVLMTIDIVIQVIALFLNNRKN